MEGSTVYVCWLGTGSDATEPQKGHEKKIKLDPKKVLRDLTKQRRKTFSSMSLLGLCTIQFKEVMHLFFIYFLFFSFTFFNNRVYLCPQ